MTLVNKRAVSVTADVKFLAADIKPSNTGGWLVITIIPVLAGKLTVIHDDETNEDAGILNNDVNVPAGAEVSLNVPVPTSEDGLIQEKVNFTFSTTTTLTKLIISEGA